MNIEALTIIGGLTLFAGVVLYLPFYFWMKWMRKKALPLSGFMVITITRNGFVFYGATVLVLFVGFAQEHVAPQTEFGLFVSTWSGRLTYGICVMVISVILETLFASIGIKFTERRNKDV